MSSINYILFTKWDMDLKTNNDIFYVKLRINAAAFRSVVEVKEVCIQCIWQFSPGSCFCLDPLKKHRFLYRISTVSSIRYKHISVITTNFTGVNIGGCEICIMLYTNYEVFLIWTMFYTIYKCISMLIPTPLIICLWFAACNFLFSVQFGMDE